MKTPFVLSLAAAIGHVAASVMPAEEISNARSWLAAVPTPEFTAPPTWEAWETRRVGIYVPAEFAEPEFELLVVLNS